MTDKQLTVLVVDDQPEICNTIRRLLRDSYNVLMANSGEDGLRLVDEYSTAIILADQRMPKMDGVTFLKTAAQKQPDVQRILITGYADITATIAAVNEAGIRFYIQKPFEPGELLSVVEKAAETYQQRDQERAVRITLEDSNQRLQSEIISLRQQADLRLNLQNLIGHSPAILNVFKLVEKVAKTTTTVLLTGETGTGKEMIARIIHRNSASKNNPFVVQNCGAIPDTLLQSELFGHKKGAFTGAIAEKKGLFAQADSGTIFLDEIGETSAAFQVGLLRVLQEGEIKPLGSVQVEKVNVRVIAATNRNLFEEVKNGRFREDLFYRLNVFPILLPPLRERKDDVPELVEFFVKKYTERQGKKLHGVDPVVIELLLRAEFPGNIRELENEVERMVTMTDENEFIGVEQLSPRFRTQSQAVLTEKLMGLSLKEAMAELEHSFISRALQKTAGNIQKAAELLGISRVGLHKMLTRLEINPKGFKM